VGVCGCGCACACVNVCACVCVSERVHENVCVSVGWGSISCLHPSLDH